ncbi:MAG: GtrA family protein [Acidimicrobiia bacterium]
MTETGTLWKAARYSAVSVVGVVLTQALLLAGHVVLDLPAGRANAAAVLVTAVPVFLLNRAWVWQLRGPSSLRREVLPFWGFTAAGLVLSTLAVAGVASLTASTAAVAAANIGAFGVLWVAKFLVLDGIVFAPAAAEVVAEAASFPVGS